MTIEKKVEKILVDFSESQHLNNISKGEFFDKDQAAQAILALIKPMSREKLSDIILEQLISGKGYSTYDMADAILAEWQKGKNE